MQTGSTRSNGFASARGLLPWARGVAKARTSPITALAVRHVAELAEIGVDSLKIEGRTKSAYYVARTASAYRRAIDDAAAGKPFSLASSVEISMKLLGMISSSLSLYLSISAMYPAILNP